MRSILISGFGPFADERRNPSGEIAEVLGGTEVAGHRVESIVLPVAREAVAAPLGEALASHQPAALIALGLATEAPVVHVEQVAVNLDDFSMPDADGAQPRGEPIVKGGPDALLASLPVGALVEAIRAEGVPAALSRSAGTYLCNHVFYLALLHATALPEGTRHRTVFLHLPSLPDSVAERGEARPSMALDTSFRAVQAVLVETAKLLRD